ncbi:DUF5753 domain-containing protein [Kitasatospora sp. NPDC059795]|uniref:DUF5753 domain-containing protein n=1 Tax=Kitasatospora sp. NPDC059795 TaxID=3346949 RepID=UPI00365940D0
MNLATAMELEPIQTTILELNRSATLIQAYENGLVHGTLQTERYARAIFDGSQALYSASSEDIEAALRARLARRELIDGDREFEIILTEQALTAPVAERDVIREQLAYLLECTGLPGMRLGVIPASTVLIQPHPFTILNSVRVELDHFNGPSTVNDPAAVNRFRDAFDRLRSIAAFGDDARALISGLI